VTRVVFDSNIIGPWVCAHGGGEWVAGTGTAIGLCADNGELKAGVTYDNYNGANIVAHISGIGNWSSNRQFLWMIFDYPFNQLKVKRITLSIPSVNRLACRLAERLGFKIEFIAEDAHPHGALRIYKMVRNDCRWLKLGGRHHG
jgi:hypothetical protein